MFDWNIERDQYKNAIISNRNLGVYFGESDPSVSGETGHQFDYRMRQ